jgi:hypothetical protein
MVDYLSKEIVQTSYYGKNVVQIFMRHYEKMHTQIVTNPRNYTHTVLERVKERFPDCQITMDPMNTYIYITW